MHVVKEVNSARPSLDTGEDRGNYHSGQERKTCKRDQIRVPAVTRRNVGERESQRDASRGRRTTRSTQATKDKFGSLYSMGGRYMYKCTHAVSRQKTRPPGVDFQHLPAGGETECAIRGSRNSAAPT